ncbi:secondary thiamine-phosphate synthase enzyme YjbQ [Maricurvus nonylphenolicus]|uniref:secondary thiamine-phosphate synthase enzyme YjbQ n=1 Tax=Maricurvus nonylphenolicus TaxID=1008307 RepID=UPI0036F3BA90
MITQFDVAVSRQGLLDITPHVHKAVDRSAINEGLCTLFIQHTSASLLIQENYDPSARVDLEAWLNRLVPENDALYTHTLEGPDDMPAHIKSALTAVSLSVPVVDGQLALGTWQGIFLWEHRHHAGRRKVIVHLGE